MFWFWFVTVTVMGVLLAIGIASAADEWHDNT